jgi:hypothetical protein
VTRRLLPAVLASAFLLLSCSAPKYQYVRNSDTRTALRIPTSWTVFDKQTMLGLSSGPQADVPDPIQWLVGIDGDPQASTGHILDSSDLTTDNPQGIALVQDLSFTERDAASIKYMRNFLFPVDQLIQNASDAAVLSYDDKIDQNGFHGVSLVFQFRASALASATSATTAAGATNAGDQALQRALLGGQGVAVLSPEFVEVDQKVFLDPASSKVYYAAILCSADCYQRNSGEIESTINSWTVIA